LGSFKEAGTVPVQTSSFGSFRAVLGGGLAGDFFNEMPELSQSSAVGIATP
jgi:hypothetical protein